MTERAFAIDWDDVRRRVEASNRALAQALDPDDARTGAIRKRRAAYLAQRRGPQGVSAGVVPALAFLVAGERYAVELDCLKEVSGPVTCTPVPGLMDELLGLANLHGEIRPVLDPAVLLGIPRKGAVNRTPAAILFLRWERREVGIGADHIEGLVDLNESKLKASDPNGAGMPRRFIKAITPETLALIDVPAMLAGMRIGGAENIESTQEGKRA